MLSFSADVLHSLFVHGLPIWSRGWINVKASGHAAIGHFLPLWVTALCATVAASMLTYVLVEQPGIALARSLTSRVWGPSERKAYARSARPAAAEQLHKP